MRFLLLLAAAAVLSSACDVQVGDKGLSLGIAEGKARDEWVRTYTLKAGGTLEIENVNGQIEATGASGSQIEVRAEREIRDHSTEAAEAQLRKIQMREEVSPDRVSIEALAPGDDGVLGHRAQLNVTYRVRVPADIAVVLKTENGGVRLDNLAGPVTASTTNGGINGQSLSGPVEADTTNGGVQLDFAAVRGDVKISTTNGGVRLQLPVDAKATIDATCINGGIDVDEEFRLQKSESSRRRLTGALNGGGPRVATTTVNGEIRIRTRGPVRTD